VLSSYTNTKPPAFDTVVKPIGFINNPELIGFKPVGPVFNIILLLYVVFALFPIIIE